MVFYSCAEHKLLSEPAPRRLAELEESRGELIRVFETEGKCIGVWAWGCCSFPCELRDELAALVGKECAILRLDNRYHVREVQGHA